MEVLHFCQTESLIVSGWLNQLIYQTLQFWFLFSMLPKPVQQCLHCSQIIPSGTMPTSETVFLILFLPWGYAENISCHFFCFCFYFCCFVVNSRKQIIWIYPLKARSFNFLSWMICHCFVLLFLCSLPFKKIQFFNWIWV